MKPIGRFKKLEKLGKGGKQTDGSEEKDLFSAPRY